MSFINGIRDFFGLDIGTTGIRVVQLHGAGPVKSLARYGQASLPPSVAESDGSGDQQVVGKAIVDLLAQTGITTANVAVGLPSHKVFAGVFDIDRLDDEELAKTIRYQADSLIPTPLADSKIDWVLLGDSPVDKARVEILLSSVPNEYLEKRLDMLEAMGLNVIAFEPDSMAILRALNPLDAQGMQMVIDMGNRTTDLVIAIGGAPRLIRSIPTGSEAIIRSAMQGLNIDRAQAEQFVFKFGMSQDKLEGQVYKAISGTVDVLVSDIEKSINFVATRYTSQKLERIILTGGASALPEFPVHIANKFGVNVEIGNPWRNVAFPSGQQNDLLAVANHFATAVGLAERSE